MSVCVQVYARKLCDARVTSLVPAKNGTAQLAAALTLLPFRTQRANSPQATMTPPSVA